jgi:hypothetical protein
MKIRMIWLMAVLLIGFIGLQPSYGQPGVNLLTNGGFEDGVQAPWGVWGDQTSEVVDTLVGALVPEPPIEGKYCLHITTNSAGANNWDYGVNQGDFVFAAGKKYTFSVFLKCKTGTLQIRLKPELGQDPWTGYSEVVVTMTDKWAEYSTTTPVFAANTTPGDITFHTAFAPAEFWMDGIRWYEGDYVPPVSPVAHDPDPADGGTHPDTWASLSWQPGNFAVSHNVYFGTNFDDVNTGAANVSYGNQAATFFIVGFPGVAYPDPLVPGTTYYWRVDEVNDLNPDSPWRGKVWSFLVPPRKAYAPNPPDTAKFLDPKATLTWKPGMGARIHHIYRRRSCRRGGWHRRNRQRPLGSCNLHGQRPASRQDVLLAHR